MSQFKKKLTAFTAMLAFLSVSGTAAFALSTGDMLGKTDNMYVGGNSSQMNINNLGATGAVGQVDWSRFNVGAGQNVNFGFSAHSQTIINRVLGGNMSEIYGKLTNSCLGNNCADPYSGTGKVILINPAGVMFGNGSQVDLNSFTVSTFDFKDAKNLKGMSTSQRSAYQADILNKLSPVQAISGKSGSGAITFDSHYTTAFNQAGITFDPNAKIILDRTAFARFNSDETINANNKTKAIALVGNHIDYKDSLVRAGSNLNYGYVGDDGNKVYNSYGAVKLITADGVTFKYTNIGSINGKTIAEDKRTNVARTIKMDNSNIDSVAAKYGSKAGKEAIKSGDIDIYNKSNAGNTNGEAEINIKNSIVKATKLVNGEDGNIYISGTKNINIENSRLDTRNTSSTLAGVSYNTRGDDGGRITVVADKDLTVKDSAILTNGSTSKGPDNDINGEVQLYSNHGNVRMDGTEVVSDGKVRVIANKNVNLNNTMIEASNSYEPTEKKDIAVKGYENVTIHNSKLVASQGDLNILSDYGSNTNNIIISSDLSNGHNQTYLYAKGKVSIQGKNTTLDNATLAYDTLTFYGDGSSVVNNVTVKNNTNFATRDGQEPRKNIVLTTNGNLTLDHATAKASGYEFRFARNASGGLDDDGYQTNIGYSFTDAPYNADNITLTSIGTGKNVSVINNSNVVVNKDAVIDAQGGNVRVADSSVTAGNNLTSTAKVDTTITNSNLKATNVDANIKSKTGNVEVIANSQITAGNNATIKADAGKVAVRNSGVKAKNSKVDAKTDAVLQHANIVSDQTSTILANEGAMYIKDNTVIRGTDILAQSKRDIDFGKDGSGKNVEKNSDIVATKNITFKSTAGNINSEKADTTLLTYNTLTFDANGSNNFTSRTAAGSDGSLQSVNVTYKAGVANNFTTDGDIRFVNSTLQGKTNNVTTVGENADVILNNLTIAAPDSVAAKNVNTYIRANGDVTTEDAVGDLTTLTNSAQHTFPQGVNVDVDPAAGVPDASGPVVNVGGTKLTIKTNVVKNADDPSNGSITLNVAGTSADAGLELVAENNVYDENIDTLEGPEVHLKSADGNPIAISKIITDKLWLDASDDFVASTIQDTSDLDIDGFAEHGANTSKGYIEVRDYGGLNLDKIVTPPDGIAYDDSFQEGTRPDPTGGEIDTFEKHKIHFENNGEDFMLVYTKPNNGCAPNPPAPAPDDPDPEPIPEEVAPAIESYIAYMRIPKEIVESSKLQRVSDTTVDQTANVMAAASKIDLVQNVDAEYDEDETEE